MPEALERALSDVVWGYCNWCKFLVPIVQVPYANAGCLEPHASGRYCGLAACGREDRRPDTMPREGVIHSIARLDRAVTERINKINDEDPRGD